MTEREMLELAAKAAGIKIEWVRNSGCFYRCEEEIGREQWSSLDDDADCFRLEDALDIEIQRTPHAIMAYANGGPTIVELYANHESKTAPRRFASTRLAAEIGKNMP